MAASSQTKECRGINGCGKILPLSEFDKHPTMKSGYKSSCKKCKREYKRKRRNGPKRAEILERHRTRQRIYAQTEEAKAVRNATERQRALDDPDYAFYRHIRSRLGHFLGRGDDCTANRNLVGCTLREYKKHIQLQFKPGMHWGNRGILEGEWSVDHIVCLAAFRTRPGELQEYQKIVCWWKNVRPAWHISDNCAKRDKWNPEEKQALIDKYNLEHGE